MNSCKKIAIAFSLTFVLALHAQYRAGLQGVVTDSAGGAVPGASVTLTSKETNQSHTAMTSESGVYTIPGLAPGTFNLTVEKTGFAKKILAEVVIRGEQMQSVNVELTVGEVTQPVTVTEPPLPLIATETATIGA